MKTPAKVGLVLGGYAVAAMIASTVVYVWVALRPDRDVSSGMAAFGEFLLLLATFAAASVPATGAALYFLRPYPRFWRILSILSLGAALTCVAAAVGYFAGQRALAGSFAQNFGAFAVLRILAAPLFALAFFLSCIFAPNRLERMALLVAALIEAAAFASVVLIAWLPALSPE